MFSCQISSLWIMASLLTAAVCAGQLQEDFYKFSPDERLKFGNLSTYISTRNLVYHIEADILTPGNIIFSDRVSIRTTNGITTTTIAGSNSSASGYKNGFGTVARFHDILSFIQDPNGKVIIGDAVNGCLRMLERQTREVTDLAGNCTVRGYLDGSAEVAKFQLPQSLLCDPRNPSLLIIGDNLNDALRFLNLTTMRVGTLTKIEGGRYLCRYIMWERNEYHNILVSGTYNVNRVSVYNLSVTNISGGVSGFFDGPLELAQYNSIEEITYIGNNLYILADRDNHRLRILDFTNNKVSSICSGERRHADGSVGNCHIWYPYSPLLLNDTLYIGGNQAIRKLPVSVESSKPTKSSPTTRETPTSLTARETPTSLTARETPTSPTAAETNDLYAKPQTYVAAIGVLSVLLFIFVITTIIVTMLLVKHKRMTRSSSHTQGGSRLTTQEDVPVSSVDTDFNSPYEVPNNPGNSNIYAKLDITELIPAEDQPNKSEYVNFANSNA